jgi:formylglycine-generating enzyme required for sulfatase activity
MGEADGPGGDAPHKDGPAQDTKPSDGTPGLEGQPKPDQQPGDGGVVPGMLVTIVKGAFSMGSPTSEPCRTSTNEDQHQVTLTHAFWILKTEVTQGQFLSLMGYNPSHFGPGGSGANCGTSCPVEQVSWHESVAYCNALSQKAGKTPCYACSGGGYNVACQEAAAYSGQKIYTCPGYRLPTEAEWEYAYRAKTQTAYYSGANNSKKCLSCSPSPKEINAETAGWYCVNSGGTTHPVGQKQKNAWGLSDMAGNVWEWCHDRYQTSLGPSVVTDPWGASSGSFRVYRGGSYKNFARSMRAAQRNYTSTTSRYSDIGFRCTRTSVP